MVSLSLTQNKAEDRKDRRMYENLSGKKKCVLVMRQGGEEKKQGSVKTKALVMEKEAGTPILMKAIRNIEKGSLIYTDEHRAYSSLDKK